jgi:hypothetical protein
VSLWFLPVPCTDSHLQIHRILEYSEDRRPKDRQDGRVQRFEAVSMSSGGGVGCGGQMEKTR